MKSSVSHLFCPNDRSGLPFSLDNPDKGFLVAQSKEAEV